DIGAVLNCTRRFIKVASYLVFPLMIGFLAVSDSFVRVVLTEKWLPASIYIQIFCISYMFNIIQHGNLQAIRAIGRSDIVLILEIIKKSIYFVVILMFILFSDKPQLLAVTAVINTVFATLINTYPNRKLIGYKYRMQVMDLLPNLLLAAAMGAAVFSLKLLNLAPIALLPLQIMVGAVVYVLGSIITRNENFYYLLSYIKGVISKKKG
ncbi:MAG: polysaccharide biosynthesis C-terminal domain-containing protein, partial [Clostridia bacterium]|nr:polysaccharide biosynthesis C-terminal domain-containing protein [Clostridia bacterium]